jgi:LemA protein
VAENYPQLKANENFLALQQELSNTEDRLQTSRRFYNANVRDYNRRVQSFPSNTIANMFHFQVAEFFEVPDAIREAGPPQVNFTREGPGVSFGSPETAPAERSTTPEGTMPPVPGGAPAPDAPPPPPPPGTS